MYQPAAPPPAGVERVIEPSIIFGYLVIGALLVLVGLVIIAIAKPVQRHLPKAQVPSFAPPEGDVVTHGLAVRADRHVLAAALVSLAVARKIRVLAPRGRRGPVAIEVLAGTGFSPDERFLLQAFRPMQLTPRQERRYLQALAEIGIHVDTVADAPEMLFLRGRGSFRRHRRRELRRFFDAARDRMHAEGLSKKRPNSVHLYLLSLLFLATAAIGLVLILGAFVNGDWLGAIPIALDVIAVFWVLTLSPPPFLRFTDRGRELRRELSGLRDYMRLAEQERLRVLESVAGALRTPAGEPTPGGVALGLRPREAADPVAQAGPDRIVLLERLLPYAILFRQERSWQREFEHLGGAADLSHNMRVLGSTLDGIMTMLDVLLTIAQIVRGIGLVLSLFGRAN